MSIGADTKSTFYREDFMQQISVKKLIWDSSVLQYSWIDNTTKIRGTAI